MSESFYRAFEDRHRGSRELIKSRLLAYKPFIEPLLTLHQPARALDIGCGRGEWLELLGDIGITAHGVDLDAGMLEACRERGLAVEQADALQTLSALPDESMALISAFHVVEHIPFDDVRLIISQALRVLQPGGLLIFETPNPENLVVGASEFYMDPTHIRPLPPRLLNFAVEHAGFHRTKIVRLQEAGELHTSTHVSLFTVLNGSSPDYSIVAQKSAANNMLALFDPAFETGYGISLDMLTGRYDDQTERLVSNAKNHAETRLLESEGNTHNRFVQWEEHFSQIEKHRIQVDNQLLQLAERLTHTEERASQAEARADQLGHQLLATLQSRSWRITAPLRYAGHQARRLRSAIKEGRIKSGVKKRIKSVLLLTMQLVTRHPRLQRLALAVLNRMPALKLRLVQVKRRMIDTTQENRPLAAPTELSPRADQIYTMLKHLMDERQS